MVPLGFLLNDNDAGVPTIACGVEHGSHGFGWPGRLGLLLCVLPFVPVHLDEEIPDLLSGGVVHNSGVRSRTHELCVTSEEWFVVAQHVLEPDIVDAGVEEALHIVEFAVVRFVCLGKSSDESESLVHLVLRDLEGEDEEGKVMFCAGGPGLEGVGGPKIKEHGVVNDLAELMGTFKRDKGTGGLLWRTNVRIAVGVGDRVRHC